MPTSVARLAGGDSEAVTASGQVSEQFSIRFFFESCKSVHSWDSALESTVASSQPSTVAVLSL